MGLLLSYIFLPVTSQIIIRRTFYRGQDRVLGKEMSKEDLQELYEDLNVSLSAELPLCFKINS